MNHCFFRHSLTVPCTSCSNAANRRTVDCASQLVESWALTPTERERSK